MSPTQFFIGLAIVVLVVTVFSMGRMGNKALVIYRRSNRQRIEEFVPIGAERLMFEGMELELLPQRATLQWYNKGILGMLKLGVWVVAYDFSWNSKFPHDPNNFENVSVTPAIAKLYNRQSGMRAFAAGVQSQMGQKQSKIKELLPWIAILAVGVVGFMVYQQGQHISFLDNMMRSFVK